MLAGSCPAMPGVARPSGARIIAQIKKAGVREIVALPDLVTSDGNYIDEYATLCKK